MENLLDLCQHEVGEEVATALGGFLDESPEHLQQAIKVGVPLILGGLIKQASLSEGAADLHRELTENATLGDKLTDDVEPLVQRGRDQLGRLFGGQLTTLLDAVSRATQIDVSKVTSLLSLLVPVVTQFLGRQQRERGWDTQQMVEALQGQMGQITSMVPAEIADTLGVAGLDLPVATLSDATHAVKEVAEEPEKSVFGKSLPILLLIVVVLAVAKFFQIRNAERPQPRPMVEEVLPGDVSPSPATKAANDAEPDASSD